MAAQKSQLTGVSKSTQMVARNTRKRESYLLSGTGAGLKPGRPQLAHNTQHGGGGACNAADRQ